MSKNPPLPSPDEETVLQTRVPPQGAGKTLLAYLAGRFRYQPIEAWDLLIREGRVTLNGKNTAPSQILSPKDKIAYRVILKEPPVDSNIRILHEEDTFLVAEKPGNLPSHADGAFIKNTFIYILTQVLRNSGWQGDVKLVHRLDRETSGLMVVAKQKEAHRNLVAQFETGKVKKEYLALVQGQVEKDSFEVIGAIGRSTTSDISIRRQVLPDGTPGAQPSNTQFETIERYPAGSLIRCLPKTGRTNQIRVHLEYVGHPVFGDKLYGKTDEEFLKSVKSVKVGNPITPSSDNAPRLMLHAHKLSFTHPETGQNESFETAMPEDMKIFMESMKIKR